MQKELIIEHMNNTQQLEAEIRAYCDEHKSYRDDKRLEDLLYERHRILNTHFKVTQEHLDQLNKMNAKLNESTEQVLGKLLRINSRLRLIFHKDGFTEDYELEGKVAVNVDGFADSEPIDILGIIDAVQSDKNLVECLFHCSGNNPNRDCKLIDYYNKDIRDGVTLIIGADKVEYHCCWAMHHLIDHTLYALEDIVRISESDNFTWNEVVLQYQNFGTYIKTKEKYCDIKL